MADRSATIKDIENKKIIVIIRGLDIVTLKKAVAAMAAGGIGLVELPFDQSGKIPDDVIASNIKTLSREFAGKLRVGAGTVLTTEQASLAADSGAEYIISPDSYEPVIRLTPEKGLVSFPGAFTPTEASNAHRCGAHFVKLFPNSELRPSFIRAITTPLSHIRFLAVGGITLDNISSYKSAGVCGYGISSAIADTKLIASGNFDAITEISRKFVEAVR